MDGKQTYQLWVQTAKVKWEMCGLFDDPFEAEELGKTLCVEIGPEGRWVLQKIVIASETKNGQEFVYEQRI